MRRPRGGGGERRRGGRGLGWLGGGWWEGAGQTLAVGRGGGEISIVVVGVGGVDAGLHASCFEAESGGVAM